MNGLLTDGGERGIRTLDEVIPHTPLAGERLQPLGHLSNNRVQAYTIFHCRAAFF